MREPLLHKLKFFFLIILLIGFRCLRTNGEKIPFSEPNKINDHYFATAQDRAAQQRSHLSEQSDLDFGSGTLHDIKKDSLSLPAEFCKEQAYGL